MASAGLANEGAPRLLSDICGKLMEQCLYAAHLFQFNPGKSLPTQFLHGISLVTCDYGSFLIVVFIFFACSICAKFKHGHD